MHGVIVTNFKRYLDECMGTDAWGEVVSTAGLQGKTYLPVALYPDEEMEALLRAAESATGLRRDDLLADFGEWVIGPLITMYQPMIPARWDAMTFLLNMQQIHERILRLKDPAATAPNIEVHKRGDDTLEIHYRSHRNMAAMIHGSVKGVAAYFNEAASLLGSEAGEGGEQRFVFHIQPNKTQQALEAV